MEFLSQFLPIIIYILLIIIIIVGIILGIKLIITIDKIESVVDDINEKVEKVTPLFNVVGMVSDKVTNIATSVMETLENIISRVFLRNRNNEMESEEDE